MSRLMYSCLFYLALPLLLWRLWQRGRKSPAYKQRIGERFALCLPTFKQGGIWVHAVSVGESIAAAPMIRALQKEYPDLPIMITCMTPTGSERIQAMFGDHVQHVYLPYDLPCAMSRLISKLQPKVLIVMETELWPNLVNQCAKRNIPIVLANARLSERSAKGYARFKRLTAPMLRQINLIAAQTQADADRFQLLGARAESLLVTGSIKFDIQVESDLLARARTIVDEWGLAQRKVWIAASTHEGEDEVVLQVHQHLLKKHPNTLLILVPRHPERFNAVYQLCRNNELETVRRSAGGVVEPSTQVFLGDSMGELMLWYALSDIAFVGGSLVERGGHNMLEPAALGKLVVSGRHVFNFNEIAGLMFDAGVLLWVENEATLAKALLDAFECESLLLSRSCDAAKLVQENTGGLALLIAACRKYFL